MENFQASIIYHEWYGHIVNGWGNGNQYAIRSNNGTHYKCYESVIGSPIFCKTTKAYQDFNNDMKKRLSK
ncbi:MAG: hypothetical protein IJU81_09475 [Bacteroidales bacterium]|nr:hypothetical protein [Bacteroidales bacterium]